MNTASNHSMGIVVYSPDFAAQQVGFVAGYEAAKAAMSMPQSVEEMSTEQLMRIVHRRLRAERGNGKAASSMVRGKRLSEVPPSVPPSMGGGRENASYPNSATETAMPADHVLIFPSRIAKRKAEMDAEIVQCAIDAVEKHREYKKQPMRERVSH